jgi:hypothetical protein
MTAARSQREPARPAAAATGQRAPLHGLLVLDFGTITAGAATGRLLADYYGLGDAINGRLGELIQSRSHYVGARVDLKGNA